MVCWTIRAAGPDDGGFIGEMLVEAVNWPPERNLGPDRISPHRQHGSDQI
jgi:hypothetical protein